MLDTMVPVDNLVAEEQKLNLTEAGVTVGSKWRGYGEPWRKGRSNLRESLLLNSFYTGEVTEVGGGQDEGVRVTFKVGMTEKDSANVHFEGAILLDIIENKELRLEKENN